MNHAYIYAVNTIFAIGSIAVFIGIAVACLHLYERLKGAMIGRKRAATAIKLLRQYYRKHGLDAPYKEDVFK